MASESLTMAPVAAAHLDIIINCRHSRDAVSWDASRMSVINVAVVTVMPAHF